jgi:hypothetical protein
VAATSTKYALLGALALAGCVGGGTGEVTGAVSAPECGLEAAAYDLDPTHFVATAIGASLDLRIQRGTGHEDQSDVLYVFVDDAAGVYEGRLGQPMPVTVDPSGGVSMSLVLGETCPFDEARVPVAYVAVSGTITFSSIYAPEVDDDALTTATFTAVRFEDPDDPDSRFAVLDGEFSFAHRREAELFP